MFFAKKPNLSRFSLGYAAFTIAEVLITLGIIGIVAEMTIPTLLGDAQAQAFKSALKKIIQL